MSPAPHTAAVPLIARIAGLPAEAMAPFGSALLTRRMQQLDERRERLARARQQLVERLFAAIGGASPAERRFLLDVKRDSFNGRSLERHRRRPGWARLIEQVGPPAECVALLEKAAAQAEAEFEQAFAAERSRERRHLCTLVDNPALLRGIALGSVVLVENLERLARTPPEKYGRRERRLEGSLLRYASRAALKLSPFSTLTRVGLGLARPQFGPSLRLVGAGAWQERSLVCLRRFLLDQYAQALTRWEPFRADLPVALADTLERLPEDRYRFVRAGFWGYDAESVELRYQLPALIDVRLSGPVIHWLLAETVVGRRTLQRLLDDLEAGFPDVGRDSLRGTVDKLLEIGFLRFVLPWTTDDLYLEKRVLEILEARPADAALAPALALLRHVVGLLEGYAGCDRPAAAVTEGKRLAESILRALAPLAGMDPQLTVKTTDRYFQEDVLLLAAAPAAAAREVVQVSLDWARRLLRSIDPLARLSTLDSSRYDFLHTVGAFAAERWPGRTEVAFLDLFAAGHRLFEEYVRYEIASRHQGTFQAPPFNPRSLPAIERLHGWRRFVGERMESCVGPDGEDMRLDRKAIAGLLDEVPGPYAASRDFCGFVQPLDAAGGAWVLNALFEGAGRLSSRYTTAMDEPMRALWVDHHRRYATYEQDGEPVELVDLFCPAGHTLNVHAAQTHRVVEIPGESSGLPAERLIHLRELRVRLSGRDGLPVLTDAAGRRLLPVHLGGLVFRFMPSLLKFLTLFGPGEFRFRAPGKKPRPAGDLVRQERHWVDDVVFRRRTWHCEAEGLRAAVRGASEARAFHTIDRWRRARGIPERVYQVEPLAVGVARPQTKPQYVDFTSPLFVELFRSLLELDVPKLSLAEALPVPESFPAAQDGRRWGVELQLDSYGLIHPLTLFADREESTCNGPLWATLKGEAHGRTEDQFRRHRRSESRASL